MMSTTAAGSGHPTSCMSAAELVAGTFFYAMKFDPKDANSPDGDRFVLSKGHVARVLYAALAGQACSRSSTGLGESASWLYSDDVKNSTFLEVVGDAFSDHFYSYIVEQSFVSAGEGLAARGTVPLLRQTHRRKGARQADYRPQGVGSTGK